MSDLRDPPQPAGARPRGRPPLDPDGQRHRILSAATDVFIERGFTDSSVAAIGRIAGVTKRTIYEVVGDKEALFRAVCVELCAAASKFHFDAAITDLPVRAILMDMAQTVLAFALSPRTIAFNRMLATQMIRFPELVVMVMQAGRSEMHETVSGIFAELVARNKIRPVDPSHAADTFYDGVVGSRAMRAMFGYSEPFPTASEIDERVDLVLHGYLEARG